MIEPRAKPLPATSNVRLDIFGPPQTERYRWDQATWDSVAIWEGPGWQDITPQSMNVQVTWGSDDAQGALSMPAAGSWQIKTYDPDRLLDPANHSSPYWAYLRPGGLVRVVFVYSSLDWIVRVGFLDSIEYDVASKTGDIRASDAIAMLSKAKTPEGLAHSPNAPQTLRARARWILQQASVAFVTVEDDDPEFEPAVGLPIDSESSAWAQIASAAFDCLHAVWIDNEGILRFRYFGSPDPTNVIIGGGTGELGKMDMDTVVTHVTLEGVYNHIKARDDMLVPKEHDAKVQGSINLYGDLLLSRERGNPNAPSWVQELLRDRGSLQHQFIIGTIRPTTGDHLKSLLALGMVSEIQLIVNKHGPVIDEKLNVLGGRLEANTETGWSAGLTTYQPAQPWVQAQRRIIRRANVSKSLEIAQYFDGSTTASSASAQMEVKASSMVIEGQKMSRICLDFAPIDWFNILELPKNAMLRYYRPYHDDPIQTEENIWLRAKRIVAPWHEGNTQWPGPATTDEGMAWWHAGSNQVSQWSEVDIGGIVDAWAPSGVGGGEPQYGILLQWYWDTPNAVTEEQHAMMSMMLSEQQPYLYLHFGP